MLSTIDSFGRNYHTKVLAMPSGGLRNGAAQVHGIVEYYIHNVSAQDFRAHRNGVLCDA